MDENLLFYFKTGGFGFVTGFILSYAFKKLLKFLILIIGLLIIGVQLIVYNGVINVN